jgi:hypothetical protein
VQTSNVSPYPPWLNLPEKDAPMPTERHTDVHSNKITLTVLQILVSCVITLVGIGSVPFALRVESRLAAIEQALKDSDVNAAEIKALRAELIDLRIQLAARKP